MNELHGLLHYAASLVRYLSQLFHQFAIYPFSVLCWFHVSEERSVVVKFWRCVVALRFGVWCIASESPRKDWKVPASLSLS